MKLPEGVHPISLQDAKPGDCVACHTKGFFGWLIRFGTRSDVNHIAMLRMNTAEGWLVNQAEAAGTIRRYLSEAAPGGEYVILSLDDFPTFDGEPVNRESVVAASDALLGEHYGFLTDVFIGIDQLMPKRLRLDMRRPRSLICSAYFAMAALAGGVRITGEDVYQIDPGQVVGLAQGRTPVRPVTDELGDFYRVSRR